MFNKQLLNIDALRKTWSSLDYHPRTLVLFTYPNMFFGLIYKGKILKNKKRRNQGHMTEDYKTQGKEKRKKNLYIYSDTGSGTY